VRTLDVRSFCVRARARAHTEHVQRERASAGGWSIHRRQALTPTRSRRHPPSTKHTQWSSSPRRTHTCVCASNALKHPCNEFFVLPLTLQCARIHIANITARVSGPGLGTDSARSYKCDILCRSRLARTSFVVLFMDARARRPL
jgi:hypothetical protein